MKRCVVLLLCLCLPLSGCYTLREVSVPGSEAAGDSSAALPIAPGDTVNVTLKSNEQYQFRVTAVTADALVGKNIRVAYADMRVLQVKRMQGWRTAGAVAGGVVAFVAAALVILITVAASNSD